MKRLDTNVGSFDGPLQETPKVLQAIGVNRAVNIGFSMIYNLVCVLIQTVIGRQRIGVQFSARRDVLSDFAVKVMLAASTDYRGANLAGFTVEQPEHNRFTIRAATVNLLCSLVGVHVPRLATDEGFIGFNSTRHLVDGSVVLRVPDAMQHEPSRLLSYSECAGDLIGTYSVLTVRKQPHRAEPLIKADSRVLEDRTDLDRELLTAFEARPHQARLEKGQPFRLAYWAFRAFGPLGPGNSFQANHRVRKVPDCLKQTALFIEFICFHDLIITLESV